MSKKENKTNVHEVEVKIDGEKWIEALDKTFDKKQKEVKVDGFRKGKVPKDIYLKKFGKESLFIDACDLVMQDAYIKAMDESKLIPVIQPTVDLKGLDESGVTFMFTITTKPEVTIKTYKGLGVKPKKVKVSKEEVDTEVSKLMEKYVELTVKEGSVENGNVAIIDFEGFKDGVAFDGGKDEGYSLEIGSNTFIPGFEEAIIGMKVGEEKDIDLVFPEEYGAEDLAGKAVVFKVKVNEIKEKIQRELDKDFFEDLAMDGVDSEDTLRSELEASIKASKEMDEENKYVDNILSEVSKQVEVDIPEGMVNEEVERLMGRFEQQMQMQGISLDLYYQFTQSNEEALKAQFEKEAYQNVLYRLMLEEIMVKEKITVTEEEASKEAEELAKKYNMDKEEFLKQFGGIDMIQYDLEMRKTLDLLKDLNK